MQLVFLGLVFLLVGLVSLSTMLANINAYSSVIDAHNAQGGNSTLGDSISYALLRRVIMK